MVMLIRFENKNCVAYDHYAIWWAGEDLQKYLNKTTKIIKFDEKLLCRRVFCESAFGESFFAETIFGESSSYTINNGMHQL